MKKKDLNQQENESQLIDEYISDLEKKDKKIKTRKHRPRYKRSARFVMPAVLVLTVALVIVSGLFLLGILKFPENLVQNTIGFFTGSAAETETADAQVQSQPNTSNQSSGEETQQNDRPTRPSKLFAAKLSPNMDFSLNDIPQFTQLLTEIESNGFTTLFLELNSETGLITDDENSLSALKQAISLAHDKAISVFGVIDITELAGEDIISAESFIKQKLISVAEIDGLDGLMLDGVKKASDSADFKAYMLTGTALGYKQYSEDILTRFVKNISNELRAKNGALLLGLVCDSVYATDAYKTGGITLNADHQMLRDDNADVLKWMQKEFFDIVFVKADTTTASESLPFEELVKWWSENTPPECDVGFMLSSSLAFKGEGIWKNPDQLTRQLMALNEINRYVFCFDSYASLKNDTTGGASLVYKYMSGNIEDDYVLRELSFTSPAKTDFTTYESSMAIIGASDPNFELLLNGQPVGRTELGYFSLQLDLKVGKNTFTFTHKGTTKTFNITYRYVVLKDYSPTAAVSLNGGDNLIVKATARVGSSVTATLNGITVTLQQADAEENAEFALFSGVFTMPQGSSEDKSIGKITFKGTHNGITESFKGGNVTVKKLTEIPSIITPPDDEIFIDPEGDAVTTIANPIGAGNRLIAEVIKYQVETFDGGEIANDLSLATNSYLPEGTLDYCNENTDYDPSSGNTYYFLRYGKRVYTTTSSGATVKTVRGTLPSNNLLAVKSIKTNGSHTVLTLNSAWKAPFTVQILPQSYQGGSGKNRTTIESRTFTYIDITFAYASQLSGTFSELEKSPIFSKAEVIKNTSSYTLRLHLEKKGEFYGWTAEYNSSGNLVFYFTNPVKAKADSNEYGGRLDGIKIVVDAGHGGADGGAQGSNKNYDEAYMNLFLAEKVASRLESIGATVVMTRTDDSGMTNDERVIKVRNAKANLVLSIHRDSSTGVSANGFGAYYFNSYTHQAADAINKRVAASGAYNKIWPLRGHVFYLSRISTCPVVLTENGFMSNSTDYSNMMKNAWNDKCADAIVTGIVDYFLEIG